MNAINSTLSSLAIGKAQTFGHLTLFPLIADDTRTRNYDTLDEALGKEGIEISEVSEGGSIPDLLLKNGLDRDVLLVDGEELVGAKQNRVLNVTVLAAANGDTQIPVSCVEAGRWGYRGREFGSSGNAHFAEGRAQKVASVTASMEENHTKFSDQHEVWDSISRKSARMDSYSSTAAMGDLYEDHRSQVEDYVAAFSTDSTQTGAVFAIGTKIKGLEVFEAPEVFQKLLPKLIRSYALDAMELDGESTHSPDSSLVTKLIADVSHAKTDTHPGVGKGEDLRISDGDLHAGALVHEDRVLHLVAFRIDQHSHRHSGAN